MAGHRLSLARLGNDVANGFSRAAAARIRERGRGRIPPAALCRHDARRRPPDRLRLSRQAAAGRRHLARDRQPRRWSAPRESKRCRIPFTGRQRHRYRVTGQQAQAMLALANAAGEGRGETCRPTGCVSRCRPNRRCRGRCRRRGASPLDRGRDRAGVRCPLAGARCRRGAGLSRLRVALRCTVCCRSCPTLPMASAKRRRVAISAGSARPGRRTSASRRSGQVMRSSASPASRRSSPGIRAPRSAIVGNARGAGHAGAPISGKIDRLAVTADAVLIVDYKTNRPAPSRSRRGVAGLCRCSSRSIARCCSRSIPGRDGRGGAAVHRSASADRGARPPRSTTRLPDSRRRDTSTA